MTKKNNGILELDLQDFLKQIMRIDEEDTDQRFCFIIGAGASSSSNIPMTKDLVDELLMRLYQDNHHEEVIVSEDNIKKWATKKKLKCLGIEDFIYSRRESFYQDLFKACFMSKMNLGRNFIEDKIEGKQPALGYLALARILSMNKHNVVITTNFDNLIADALSIFSKTYARVVGHEHLASYAEPTNRRPLIVKIHRDWLFDPNNSNVHELPEKWVEPLTDILHKYTPIVLGYAGNDGGLLGFMKKLTFNKSYDNKHNIYWCYRYSGSRPTNGDLPSTEILNIIKKHNGVLVPHKDFDATMLKLFTTFKHNLPDDLGISQPSLDKALDNMKSVAIRSYHRERELLEKLYPPGVGGTAPSGTSGTDPGVDVSGTAPSGSGGTDPGPDGSGTDPGADGGGTAPSGSSGTDPGADGGGTTPSGSGGTYTDKQPPPIRNALSFIKKRDWRDCELEARQEPDIEKRKVIYEKGLTEFQESWELMGNYAHFLKAHKEYDKAETLYRNALAINPKDSMNTGNFAFFMDTVRNNIGEAEELYEKSISIEPVPSENTTRYAFFLYNQQRYEPALKKAKHVLNNVHNNRWAARSAFCACLAFNNLFKTENPALLGRLKKLLDNGFERGDSLFYGILETSLLKIPEGQHDFYKALALAIEDQSKVSELNAFTQWKEIKPIDLADSWED